MRRRASPLLIVVLLAISGFVRLQAQVTVYTWTGLSGDDFLYVAGNWLEGVAPANVLSTDTVAVANALTNTQLVFGNSGINSNYYFELFVNKLSFSGNVTGYQIQGDFDTTHIGSGGVLYSPASAIVSNLSGNVRLESDQPWNIQSGNFIFSGAISDSTFNGSIWVSDNHTITKTGAGTLSLYGVSPNWEGGLVLTAGRVAAVAQFDTFLFTPLVSNSLGTGTLTFNGGTLVAESDPLSTQYPNILKLENDVVSNGLISIAGHVPISLENSTVTLNADTTIKVTGETLNVQSGIVEVGGARKLTVDSPAPVFLSGASGWTGGTDVLNTSVLVFGGINNLPAAAGSIKMAANSYVGIAGLGNSVGTLLAAFDKANTFGTIGFDLDTFTTAIDLTGFNANVRLGSATEAILDLTATITPQGSSYRFGGGGGMLDVRSALVGANSLVLDSPSARPLTLRLTNDANSWTGGTSVTHSGLVFGAAPGGSFSGAAGSILINQGGFVSFGLWGDQTTQQFVDNSLSLINATSVGAVGFDGIILSGANFNLSGFSGALYLASADIGYIDDGFGGGTVISSTITPAGGAGAPFRFAGYKGGLLEVISALTGSNGIMIGDPNSPATFGDPLQQEYSTVALSGNNSGLSGDITFFGGQLGVGQSNGFPGTDPTNALGSGNLIVQGTTLPTEWADAAGNFVSPKLVVESFDTIIPNNVVLNTDLAVGGWPDFKLAGVISGPGGIAIEDDIELTLSGNNTFSGGIFVGGNALLAVFHNNATGTGPLEFGDNSSAIVTFETAAPVIGGLNNPDHEFSNDYSSLFARLPNTVLTINQSTGGMFEGVFDSLDVGAAMRVVKNGTGNLTLGYGSFQFANGTAEASLPGTPNVGLQINQGTVVFGQDFSILTASHTIWVHGGTLALANWAGFYSINNPVLVDNGGRITGNGFLGSSISIGTGATLAPGAAFAGENPIGRLDFAHIDAKAGGTLEWDIMKADPAAELWDQIFVSTPLTLDFSTINLLDAPSPSTRFTLKVVSRDLAGAPGALADFNPANSYSWLVFSSYSMVGFDPGRVLIDTSLFANSLNAGSGNGYFFLNQVGTDLFLNFSPVPEPSTYALLASGLAIAGLRWRRRAFRRNP